MQEEWLPFKQRLLEAASLRYVYPEDRFSGRGIVTCAGGEKYFVCAYVMIRLLRQLGCTLPIEVWHLGPDEMPGKYAKLLHGMDVKTIDARKLDEAKSARILNGWEVKPFSIINSSFEEVLFLDADNTCVMDPAYLFDMAEYRKTGAVFWPDRGQLSSDCALWSICNVKFRSEPEFESGQMLIDKRRCWKALQITKHLNDWSDFYYRFIYGDKETFHFAWRLLEQEYAMAPANIDKDWKSIYQHDFQLKRIFQHRSGDKWTIRGSNIAIDDFEHELLCKTYVNDLRGELSADILGYFDHVFVLNLDQDADRMHRMEKRLHRLCIPFERISATKHANGRIGCALTHKHTLELAMSRGYLRALILEDDVLLRDDIGNQMIRLIPQLNKVCWDMFYLGLHLFRKDGVLSENLGRVGAAHHTHAYSLQTPAIPTILKKLNTYLAHPEGDFDGFHGDDLFKVYADPILAIQEPGYSHTLGRDFDRFSQYFDSFSRTEFENNCQEMDAFKH